MGKILEDINQGFISKDYKLIYKSLITYFNDSQNEKKIQLHPLGFKYLKLGSLSKEIDFRLHFWTNVNQKQDKELQIHDHSFDFESLVINGRLKNIKFNIFSYPNSTGYIYDVKFRNENSKLILKSDCQNINILSDEIIEKDNFYSMMSNEFHESINLDNNLLTLLKINRENNKVARVFSQKKLDEIPIFKRDILNIEDNQIIINKIKAILSARVTL